MLLQEGNRQTDQQAETTDRGLLPGLCPSFPQPHRGNGHRTCHMHRRTYSRGGVDLVQKTHHRRQQILPRKDLGPQFLTAGPEQIHSHRHKLDKDKIGLQFSEAVHGIQKKVSQREQDQKIPAHIKDHKFLPKRDPVIQSAMNHMTPFRRNEAFCEHIQGEINHPSQQQFQMGKLRGIEIVKPKCSVIGLRLFHRQHSFRNLHPF